MMIQYHRDVIEYLESIGALQIVLEDRGKHKRISFDWKGENKFLTVAKSPSDKRALQIKKGDIRRMLNLNNGKSEMDHIEEVKPFNRINLEPYTSKVENKKEITSNCTVSFYPGNKSLRFKIPKEVFNCLPKGKFNISKSSSDTWDISPGTRYSFRKEGTNFVIDCSLKDVTEGYEPFYATKAEVVVVDNHALIRLVEIPAKIQPNVKEEKIQELISVKNVEEVKEKLIEVDKDDPFYATKAKWKEKGPEQEVDNIQIRTLDGNWIVDELMNSVRNNKINRTDIKAVLRAVRYIERNSDFKLIRLQNSQEWVFDDRID